MDKGRMSAYVTRPQRLFIAAILAVELAHGLFLGGGVAILSRSQGQVDLQGEVALSQPALSSLQSSIDMGLFGVRYPQAGLLWEMSDRISIGLSYRHSFRLEIDQKFIIDGSLGDPGQKPLVEKGAFEAQTRIRDLFQPAQLTLGAAVQHLPRLLLTAHLTWARWSEFPAAPPMAVPPGLRPPPTPPIPPPPPPPPRPPRSPSFP